MHGLQNNDFVSKNIYFVYNNMLFIVFERSEINLRLKLGFYAWLLLTFNKEYPVQSGVLGKIWGGL